LYGSGKKSGSVPFQVFDPDFSSRFYGENISGYRVFPGMGGRPPAGGITVLFPSPRAFSPDKEAGAKRLFSRTGSPSEISGGSRAGKFGSGSGANTEGK
jgi:hypothetical protein